MVARLEKWDMVLVWCPRCDLEAKRDTGEVVKSWFYRKQDMFHQRMVSSAAKRYEPALGGDSATVPIERPDKINSLSQQNV